MRLTKIKIENFKSIQEIEFEIKKYGSSYTTMFLGVNESGKSNILEAMSFLEIPGGKFEYQDYHNQKDESDSYVDLWFSLDLENNSFYIKQMKSEIESGAELLNFEIINVEKNVFLSSSGDEFRHVYNFDIENLTPGLFIKVGTKNVTNPTNSQVSTTNTYSISKTAINEEYQPLSEETFIELFKGRIATIIRRYEPSVTFWEPSDDFLISTEDLVSFSDKPYSKPALKNIFLLAGYEAKDSIKEVVARISNGQQRSKLQSKLQESLNDYIKNVWNHNIEIVIDITETGQFTLSIRDTGEKNKHDRFPINGRSQGARHFLSLILSLSIESKHDKLTNQLILIDEPEVHLHPSGIRDLRDELLKIGEKNFLFVSTHSPFLVDKTHKERNIIIKKNSDAKTEKKLIQNYADSLDDEVLYEAFGLDVYKDLLNPHSILVEGASDKVIIQKALAVKIKPVYGITNGHGSNIVTLAAKLNDTVKSVLVVLDDDKDGRAHKNRIIKLGSSYTEKNVVTLKELVGSIPEGCTIEDSLGKTYVETAFHKFYNECNKGAPCDLVLADTEPFIKQVKAYLYIKGIKDNENLVESFKGRLANSFKPARSSFEKNFPLLDKLVAEIAKKLP
ncbi:ATP-dependent nuclease [Methylophilus luteus]|uniref:ATP-dependent endonuclease n=1 Tax=Methylophilus luteus TaxID=640108 RepID=A0ABW3FCH7_9PROT